MRSIGVSFAFLSVALPLVPVAARLLPIVAPVFFVPVPCHGHYLFASLVLLALLLSTLVSLLDFSLSLFFTFTTSTTHPSSTTTDRPYLLSYLHYAYCITPLFSFFLFPLASCCEYYCDSDSLSLALSWHFPNDQERSFNNIQRWVFFKGMCHDTIIKECWARWRWGVGVNFCCLCHYAICFIL